MGDRNLERNVSDHSLYTLILMSLGSFHPFHRHIEDHYFSSNIPS